MKDKIALFIGPSMTEGTELGEEINIFGPIKSGDIYKLMTHGYNKIGIVDGVFHGVPSIWHREIRYAIEHGIDIYGSSSMGALRAAEMDTLGVTGVGQVYEWYSSGHVTGDDEVALCHLPEYPYEATTIPLVDIRNILANKMNISIESKTHSEVIELCRTIVYWHRTTKRLRNTFNEEKRLIDIYDALIQHIPNTKSIKKIDAELLIHEIQERAYKNLDTLEINQVKPPSLTIDLYSDFAIGLRQNEKGQSYNFSDGTNDKINHTRSALVHSFLTYWIEDKDPYGMKSESMKKTKTDSKNNIQKIEEIMKEGILKEELQNFIYLSNYFYSIIDSNKISLSQRLLESAQTYLENNPAKDTIFGSFPQFSKGKTGYNIKQLIAYEIHMIEEAFDEYGLDRDNLVELYISIYTKSKIKDLEISLQKYILIGTFGSSTLGCVQNVIQAHVWKFAKICSNGGGDNE